MEWSERHISSVLASRSSQGTEEGNICVYTDPYVCMHVYMHMYVSTSYIYTHTHITICIYINLNMNYYFPNSSPLQYGTVWPLSRDYLLTAPPVVKNLPPTICTLKNHAPKGKEKYTRSQKNKNWRNSSLAGLSWKKCFKHSSGKRKYDTGKKLIYTKKKEECWGRNK